MLMEYPEIPGIPQKKEDIMSQKRLIQVSSLIAILVVIVGHIAYADSKITTNSGSRIEIDTSEEACKPFGFLPGEKVQFRSKKGVVLGVAQATTDPYNNVLWVKFEGDRGAVYFGDKCQANELVKIQ
jgi:hypothetical protein